MSKQLTLFTCPENNHLELLPFSEYDKILISYSGGKDSLACILYLLEQGVSKDRIELWHQDVDGAPDDLAFIDWPVTENYVRVTGQALGLKVEFQWRQEGFLGELLREDRRTNDVEFTLGDEVIHLPTRGGKCSTRRKFPAKSADLSRRWCSAYLKIDVFRRAVNNHPAFQKGKILVITGERWEESAARSKYLPTELHPCNTQKRIVHWWRSVVEWDEAKIWEIIERHGITPHPAYVLGWNRTSCFGCIFSTPDLWAMMREIAPDRFNLLVEMEHELGFTVDNKCTLTEMADKGKSRVPKAKEASEIVQQALQGTFSLDDFWQDKWELPAGAFRGAEGGPT